MANRFKDFDAAWAESASAPLVVRVKGKTYELPAKLPAKVVIVLARERLANKDKPESEKVSLETTIELLEPFFGKGILAEWVDAGLDVDQLGDVFKWSMAMYNGDDPDTSNADDEETDPNS